MSGRMICSLSGILAVAGCMESSLPLSSDSSPVVAADYVSSYTLVKVDRIDMGPGRAYAINDAGVAVGYQSGPTGEHMFRWTKSNGLQLLAVPGRAFDINSNGDIVGNTGGEAFLRWANGSVTVLGTLNGGDDSEAYALNDSRHVVGRTDDAQANAQYAFRWVTPGPMQNLHLFFFNQPHNHSVAYGINSSDHVVGWAQNGYIKDAFEWSPIDGASFLPKLGGATTIAHDVNDAGVIVGQSEDTYNNLPFGLDYAVKWKSGNITTLSTAAQGNAAAHGINENEYVVGVTEALGATMWQPSGQSIELGHLPGGSSSQARDVNKNLEAVGWGVGPNYDIRAIYWKVTLYRYTLTSVSPWAVSPQPPYFTLGSADAIEVAVLTDRLFDATRLDPSLFTLGDWQNTDTPIARDARGLPIAMRADVDRDGDLDLVMEFDQAALERIGDLTENTTELILSADLGEGEGIFGRNQVRVRAQ